jgi:hypothetical protein
MIVIIIDFSTILFTSPIRVTYYYLLVPTIGITKLIILNEQYAFQGCSYKIADNKNKLISTATGSLKFHQKKDE